MPRFLASSGRKHLSVEIHPAAKPAYEFFHSQSMRFSKVELGKNCIDLLFSSNIYLATAPFKNKIHLVSGFEIIGFSLVHLNLKDLTIIIDNDLTDKDVETKAWGAVLRNIFSSVNCHHLDALRKQLNQSSISPELMTQIFNSNVLSQEQLATISGLSISGLKKQRHNKTKSLSHTESEAEFEIFQKIKARINEENTSG